MSHQNLTPEEVLRDLPGQVLIDVARNDAASYPMRKAAVKLLLEKNFPQANHPEVALMRREILSEREAEHEVAALVESQIEAPIESVPTQPPSCGVTTASLGFAQPGDTE